MVPCVWSPDLAPLRPSFFTNVGPTWGGDLPAGGCGVSSRMLAPPSVRIFTSGCRRGGRSGAVDGWSCSSRSGGTGGVEGLSIRELADRHRVHRRTVRQALADAVPPPRKAYPPRARPAIDPCATVIDGWLLADQDVPRKQRHTARRVWQRLVAEHGATRVGGDGVALRRPPPGRARPGPASRWRSRRPIWPGAEAEVDFGEFYATIAGAWIKCWMFVMRLSHSGRAFHVAFGTQAQEAFLEGHVLAFAHFGGVPGRIRYDNLKPAVVRVLQGPRPDRVGAVHRAAQPLRVRLVLLPSRHRRRAREGRRRGRDRPVPAPPPRPGPEGRRRWPR